MNFYKGEWIGLALICVSTVASVQAADFGKDRKRLISGTPAEQAQAMSLLTKGGAGAAAQMLDAVENENDPEARQRADRVLDTILKEPANRNEEQLETLVRLSRHSDRQRVESATTKLMYFKGKPRAYDTLKALAKTHSDQAVRAKAFGALMVQTDRDKKNVKFMEEAFDDEKSAYVKAWVAGYLGSLGSKKGLTFCRDALRNKDLSGEGRAVQMRAAMAAGRIGDAALIPDLEVVANSSDSGPAGWEARVAIKAIALKNLPSVRAKVEYLNTLLEDPVFSRWAANELGTMKEPAARELLKNVAKDSRHKGASEARIALVRAGEPVEK